MCFVLVLKCSGVWMLLSLCFGYLLSSSQGPCYCAVGLGRFLSGITDEMKQRYRERLFAVTDKNLIDVAGR